MFEDRIKEAIVKVTKLKKKDIEIKKPFGTAQKFADLSFPCFGLSKNPKKLAQEIKTKISKKLPKEIEKIEAMNGYVNFFLNKGLLTQNIIEKILKEKNNYGSLKLKGKALIEHTSINPNASPHVGRIRNAIVGDILSRLLKFHKYKTEIHYYMNDVSKQMALLVLGMTGKEKFDDLLILYVKMSEELQRNPNIEKQVFEILEKIESGDKETIGKLNKLIKIAVEGQSAILAKLGIFYDSFDYESRYVEKSKLKKILKQLEKTKRLEKDIEGRYVLNQGKMKKYNFENEMKSPVFVLTRSNGTALYPVRDIVYTIDKMKTAPVNIIVLGEDQKLYFKQLKAALELLGQSAPRVVHYSFILLKTKKGAKKMATRKGQVVLMSHFIKEAITKARQEIKKRGREKNVNVNVVSEAIGVGTVRYSIAKVERNKGILFDWEEALNFEGNSAPYLQYTYARASSILKRIRREKLVKPSYKVNEKEYALAKKLMEFPKIASDALDKLEPHLLCNYIYTLSQCFNDFYEGCSVIKAQGGDKARRAMLVQATCIVLKTLLDLLGLPALEAM